MRLILLGGINFIHSVMSADFYMGGTAPRGRNAARFAFLFSGPRWKCGAFLVYIFE
jgi:hypothetical protein